MIFKRIRSSLFLEKEATLFEISLFPQLQHPAKKEISEAQSILGTVAQWLTLQASPLPISSLSPEHGCNVKTFLLYKAYVEKGKHGNWHRRISCQGRKRMFALWVQHRTKCCRKEANTFSLKLEVSWNMSRRV